MLGKKVLSELSALRESVSSIRDQLEREALTRGHEAEVKAYSATGLLVDIAGKDETWGTRAEHEKQKEENLCRFWIATTVQVLLVLGSWGALIAAASYARTSIQQLRQVTEANSEATQRFESAERARVQALFDGVDDPHTDNPRFRIDFWVHGNSPALRVRYGLAYDFRRLPVNKSSAFSDPDLVQGPITLFAGSQEPMQAITVHVSRAARALWRSGEYAPVIHGMVRYESFRKEHFTRFCFVADNANTPNLVRCGTYNETDEQ